MARQTTTRPKKTRYRRSKAKLDALLILARRAALDGKSLASIRARLHISEPTLTIWTRQAGYRKEAEDACGQSKKDSNCWS